MTYYAHLDLDSEPFAPTAAPRFLYRTEALSRILDSMEIAILLRRGLCVCLGGPGMGKTMLCKALSQELQSKEHVLTYLLLSPLTGSHSQFAHTLHACILGRDPEPGTGFADVMQAIERGVKDKAAGGDGVRTNQVLLVDEGQRLTPQCLEILRELLNLEDENGKLLQMLIFAGPSFEKTLAGHPAFTDRIYEIFRLSRLRRDETAALLIHRMQIAGASRDLFTKQALLAVHSAAKGVPRKAVFLAHKVILNLVDQDKPRATLSMVRAVAGEQGMVVFFSRSGLSVIALALSLLLFVAMGLDPLLDLLHEPEAGATLSIAPAPPIIVQESTRTGAVHLPLPGKEPGGAFPNDRSDGHAATAEIPAKNELAEVADLGDHHAAERELDAPGADGLEFSSPDELHDVADGMADPGQAMETGQEPPALLDAHAQSQRRFIVQVGAFSTPDQADRLLQAYLPSRPDAGVLRRVYMGRTYYVTYLARFEGISQAFDLVRTLREEKGVLSYVIDVTQDDYFPVEDDPKE